MADNASITILRNTKANIDAEPIKDGNILFTTDQAKNKIYTDVGTTRIQIGGTVDVDTELSTTSTNPVQNKVITNSIDDVKGQIHTNLLNPTAQTQTINGVTFTNNGDGTYTVNGTANKDAYIQITTLTVKDTNISVFQNSKLVGCPKGGGTYSLYINLSHGYTWITRYSDVGNGVLISNIPSNVDTLTVNIMIKNGTTANNLLFKPMLTTDLSATYDDFVPYIGDSGRLNEDVANLVKGISGGISPITNSEIDTILNS